VASAHYALVPNAASTAALTVGGELPVLHTETHHQFKALEALKRTLRLDAVFLRVAAHVPRDDERDLVHQFDAPPESWEPKAPAEWMPLDEIRSPPEIGAAVEQWLDELRGAPVHPDRPPWARPGWLAEASEWAGGGPKLIRQWPLSAVYRFDNDFFKAVFTLFHAEPDVTEALAREHPGDVPEVVRTNVERGWMLMRQLPGRSPRGPEALVGMRTAARVQRAWAGRESELASFGCRHRGLDELRTEAPQLAPLCDELEGLGIPDTIVHGDLHQGNMLVSDHRTSVIDWSDAAIGHPFLDLAPVLWIGDRQRDDLAEAYIEAWADLAPREVLLRAAAIGEALGCVYQAISYRAINAALEPADRWLFANSYEEWLERAVDLGNALQPG
jgi:Phosphotransferase enzyme family